MKFNLNLSLEILQRTPDVLSTLVAGLSDSWTLENEGEETWSVYDIVGHLIHGEQTDWIPRMEIILSGGGKVFEPFNRFAQFEESKGKSLLMLLAEFKAARQNNIEHLLSKKLSPADLERKGIHPDFGEVSLSQLLSTWVAHDLNHIAQICRVMANQYKNEVGPWAAYLGILRQGK